MDSINADSVQIQKNNVIPFEFHTHSVRVVSGDPLNPLFVAQDVAKALGYTRTRDAIKQHCKGAVKHRSLFTGGGMQKVRVISEPNLYRLIFGSKLKSAEKFQDWVFEEVLPAIRKTGTYDEVTKLTPAQKKHINYTVKALVKSGSLSAGFSQAWKCVHDRFNVSSYAEIPEHKYPEVCKFLGVQPLEGEYLGPETLPSLDEQPVACLGEGIEPASTINGYLRFEQMHDCGWLLKTSHFLQQMEQAAQTNQRVTLSAGAVAAASLELRSLASLCEMQRGRLHDIGRLANR